MQLFAPRVNNRKNAITNKASFACRCHFSPWSVYTSVVCWVDGTGGWL